MTSDVDSEYRQIRVNLIIVRQRDIVSPILMSVCLSVRLSNAGIVSKQMDISSHVLTFC